MTFVDTVLNLLTKKGISKNKMLSDLGLGKNSFVNWTSRGTIPNGETLQKIADYFGVSVDYLLGKQDEPLSRQAAAEIESTLSAEESEILKKLKQLDDDQAKQMLDYLDFLIQQRNKKDGK